MTKHLKNIIQAGLHKLDLVTREEFDIQVLVLSKTRAKLELLEKKIAEIELKNK